jgi:hypothetical protein
MDQILTDAFIHRNIKLDSITTLARYLRKNCVLSVREFVQLFKEDHANAICLKLNKSRKVPDKSAQKHWKETHTFKPKVNSNSKILAKSHIKRQVDRSSMLKSKESPARSNVDLYTTHNEE